MWTEKLDPSNAHERRRRISALLGLWQTDSFWRRSDEMLQQHSDTATFETSERNLWRRILDLSQAWPPRTTRRGLHLLLGTARACGEPDVPSFDELAASPHVRIRGPRVHFSDSFYRAFPSLRMNYTWALAVPLRPFRGDEAAVLETLTRVFHYVRCVGAHFVCTELKERDLGHELALLLAQLVLERAQRALEIGFKAIALAVDLYWYDMLTTASRRQCVELLRGRLERDERWLGATEDLILGGVEEAQARAFVATLVGDGRFRELRLVERHVPHDPLQSDFHSSLAQSIAHGGDAGQIGETLRLLPVGRAWYTALHWVQSVRPQLWAQLLMHPSWRAAGAFGARGMIASRRAAASEVDLAQHQDELQRLIRWEVIASDDADPADAFDVAAADFAEREGARFGLWKLPAEAHSEPWRHRLRDVVLAKPFVDWLVLALARRPSDGLFCAAQQLLPILGLQRSDHARRVAIACVDAYVASLQLGARRLSALRTRGFPERLWEVVATLRGCGLGDAEDRLLRPFDAASYATTSRQDFGGTISSETACPPLDARTAIRTHAVTLFELLDSAPEGADLEPVVDAVVGLCVADLAARGDRRVFDWTEHVDDRPAFRRLGVALARSPRALVHARAVLKARPPILALAQLLGGVPSGAVAEIVRVELRKRAPRERKRLKAGVALGEANALASALLDAGEPADALVFANDAVSTVTKHKIHSHHAEYAFRLRWLGLLRTGAVAELLKEDATEWKARTLLPLQAVGLANGGDHAKARALLDQVLRVESTHPVALVNRVATLIQEKLWTDAATAADHAKTKLGDKAPPELHLSSALANAELRRWNAAQADVDALPPEYARSPLGLRVRIQLWSRTIGTGKDLREDVDALDSEASGDARELRELLSSRALDWELHTLVLGGADGGGAIDFDEHCRRVTTAPDAELELRLVEACKRLAQHPDLVRSLSEDHHTQILAWLLAESTSGLRADVGERVGVGPRREGVADLTIWTADARGRERRRALVRGEAKKWRGGEWIDAGRGQALAVGNAGDEHFALELVYCAAADFERCVRETRAAIAAYSVMVEGRPWFVAEGSVERKDYGTKISVLRSVHRAAPDGEHRRQVRTILVDVQSVAEREARAPKAKAKARSKKATNPAKPPAVAKRKGKRR